MLMLKVTNSKILRSPWAFVKRGYCFYLSEWGAEKRRWQLTENPKYTRGKYELVGRGGEIERSVRVGVRVHPGMELQDVCDVLLFLSCFCHIAELSVSGSSKRVFGRTAECYRKMYTAWRQYQLGWRIHIRFQHILMVPRKKEKKLISEMQCTFIICFVLPWIVWLFLYGFMFFFYR